MAALDLFKAMGLDEISPRILKACALPFCLIVHHLFSLCLVQHKLPQEWKVHKTVPIYKSIDKAQIENYRPISLLSVVSKMFERVVIDKVKDFILETIYPSQFGFMPNHLCIQQIFLFISSIMEKWDNQSISEVVYLDIREVFDSVHHMELLAKLHKFGVVGNLWYLFYEYLTSRLQCVAIEDSLSEFLPVHSGVP